MPSSVAGIARLATICASTLSSPARTTGTGAGVTSAAPLEDTGIAAADGGTATVAIAGGGETGATAGATGATTAEAFTPALATSGAAAIVGAGAIVAATARTGKGETVAVWEGRTATPIGDVAFADCVAVELCGSSVTVADEGALGIARGVLIDAVAGTGRT